MQITEWQQGVAKPDEWPLVGGQFRGRVSGYTYVAYQDGLHRFNNEDGKPELFSRTKQRPASWHLQRGAWCFEFCRSA